MLTALAPSNVELTINKGQPNGYAALDANGDLTGIVVARTLTNANVASTSFQPGEFVYVTDLKQAGIGNSTTAGDLVPLQSLPLDLSAPPVNLTTTYLGNWVGKNTPIATFAAGKLYILSWGNDVANNGTGHPLSLIWDTLSQTLSIGDPTDVTGASTYTPSLTLGGALTCAGLIRGSTLVLDNISYGGATTSTITSTRGASAGNYLVDATAGPITITLIYDGKSQFKFKRIDGTANAITITESLGKLFDGAANVTLANRYAAIELWMKNNAVNVMGRYLT